MIKNSQRQNGSAHVVIIVILVVALLGALGLIFWQNFMYKEPIVTKTEVVKTDSDNEPTDDSQKTKVPKAPLTKAALEVALPVGCMLGISDGSANFDTSKLTEVTESSPSLGPLEFAQHGRVNKDQTWTYVAGGCGSNAGAFVLKDNAGTWGLVAYHAGDAWFGCEKVDNLGIPNEVVGLCLDGSNERAIR